MEGDEEGLIEVAILIDVQICNQCHKKCGVFLG